MKPSVAIAAAVAVLLGLAVSFFTLLSAWKSLVAIPSKPSENVTIPPHDWDFWTLEIGALSEELLKERQALDDRKKDLDAWQKRLETGKGELVRLRDQIISIRDEIDQSVVTLMLAEKPNIKNLSRSYSAMKTAQAVAIFRKTNDDMVVKILSLMKPDIVAAILSEMAAEPPPPKGAPEETLGAARAARITEMLRLLKQETPKE